LIGLSAGLLIPTAEAGAFHKLQVSSNGRFLVQEGGSPFFWLGDTAWFLPKVSNADVTLYLDDRVQKGFTGILIACKYHDDVLYNGQGAFVNDNTDTPNETFWQHVDFILTEAENRGLYVAITIMWAEDYQALGLGDDTAKAYRLGKRLGTRYRNRNNVLWVISGEYNDTPGWTKALYDSVAQGLSDGHAGNHLMTIHSSIGSSSQDFHSSSWLDFNIIQSGHQSGNHAYGYSENYELVASDYGRSPVKPTADWEPSYEDFIDGGVSGSGPNGPRIKDDTVRRKAYWNVFAGGFGHTYGNENLEVMYEPGDDSSFVHRYWKDALHDPGARHVRHLRSLIESRSFLNRVPDQSIVTSGQGTGIDRVQATRASDGSYALIYIPSGGAVSVNMAKLSGPNVVASWFNPRDGSASVIGNYANSGAHMFDAPGATATGNDWVLALENGNSGPTPTPTQTLLPSGSPCTTYTYGSAIRQGFGVPWDVTNPSIMLVSASYSGSMVALKAGTSNPTPIRYIYKDAYVAPSGASSWTPVPLFGSSLIFNAWYQITAQGTAMIHSLSIPVYYVAYTCLWTGTTWKCGCRDQACTQSYWQIQKIQQ
jgi:Protein of unknown function (DUF4038)/Putative collagen-binding domain of a collagenase